MRMSVCQLSNIKDWIQCHAGSELRETFQFIQAEDRSLIEISRHIRFPFFHWDKCWSRNWWFFFSKNTVEGIWPTSPTYENKPTWVHHSVKKNLFWLKKEPCTRLVQVSASEVQRANGMLTKTSSVSTNCTALTITYENTQFWVDYCGFFAAVLWWRHADEEE